MQFRIMELLRCSFVLWNDCGAVSYYGTIVVQIRITERLWRGFVFLNRCDAVSYYGTIVVQIRITELSLCHSVLLKILGAI